LIQGTDKEVPSVYKALTKTRKFLAILVSPKRNVNLSWTTKRVKKLQPFSKKTHPAPPISWIFHRKTNM